MSVTSYRGSDINFINFIGKGLGLKEVKPSSLALSETHRIAR